MIKQLRFVFAVGLATGLFGASGVASATTCSSATNSYNLCGTQDCRDLILGSHPECFGSSSNTAAGAMSIQATSLEQMLAVSANVGNRGATLNAPPGVRADSGNRKGLAAGNPVGKWNGWASVAASDVEYDRGTYFFNGADRTNRFDTQINNFVFGGDYQYAPNLILGLSLARDSGRGSMASHSIVAATAADRAAKTVHTSGYSYAPYLGWQIDKDWALDATIGGGAGKSTVDDRVRTDSKRLFLGTNLGYTSWRGNWQLTGKGGFLFGRETSAESRDAGNGVLGGTGVTNEVGQVRFGGQAAYWMDGVMPYFGIGYVNDYRWSTATASQQEATAMGKSAVVWSLGANFISIKNSMTGGIGYEAESERNKSKNAKIMANINIRF